MTPQGLKSIVGLAAVALLGACAGGGRSGMVPVADPAPIVTGTMRPYQIRGRWFRPEENARYDETGLASWYGDQFHGRPTASGERFDMNALTAAHRTLPLPGLVEVTDLESERRIVVRINDRGPFVDDRIIDLSRAAADALGLRGKGLGRVRVRYLGRAPRLGEAIQRLHADAQPRRPSPRAAEVAEGRRFWVEAGAYADRDEARAVAAGLGTEAAVDIVQHQGLTLYRVLVGPWPDPNRAERSRTAALALGHDDARLISGP